MCDALRSVGVWAFTLALLGCGDEAPPGAATRFETSACKAKSGGQGLLAAAQQVTPHEGLRCVTWEARDGGVRFGLTNFEGGCGVQYAGQAYVAGGGQAVTLSLTNPGGAVAACGWCVYDFAFEVTGVAPNVDLALAVERSNSPGRSNDPPVRFDLPAAGRGVVCDYGNGYALAQLAEATGKVGQRNWPCTGLGDPGPPRCQAGLTCTSVEQSGPPLCLWGCADDAGCGDAMFACRDGVCRIRTLPR